MEERFICSEKGIACPDKEKNQYYFEKGTQLMIEPFAFQEDHSGEA